MSKKVLIVEDDPGISLSLKDEFESLGYIVLKPKMDGKVWTSPGRKVRI